MPSGQVQHGVEVGNQADVLRLPVIADPGVGPGELAADLLGAVIRRVVGDHQLDAAVLLVQHRSHRFAQVALAVPYRQPDRDEGLGRSTHADPPGSSTLSSQISLQKA